MKKIGNYIEFLLREKGEDLLHNGNIRRAIISNSRDYSSFYYDKFLRTDFEIYTGDLIEYQNNKWLITSEINQDAGTYRGRMRRCNYRIRMVINEVLQEFDAILEGQSFGIDEGKTVNLANGKLQVILSSNLISNQIALDMRFISIENAWKVVGIDKSRLGLIILHCEKCLFGTNDDKKNEIADQDKIAQWSIFIEDMNMQVGLNKPYEFTALVRKNGIEDTTESVVWESSDGNIAVVENGLVNGISLGTVTISAYLLDKPTIRTSIAIEIVEAMEDIVTYKLWASNIDGSGKSYIDYSIKNGKKYVGVEKFINGTLAATNDTYSFVLDANGVPLNKYRFKVIDDYKCEIERLGDHQPQKLLLKATCNQTGTIVEGYVELRHLF